MGERESVKCWIYRSDRKVETYLYLAREDGTDSVPPGLLQALQPLVMVMELELHPQRKLARADVAQVIRDLSERGFYLQMPPTELERLTPASPTSH